MEAPIHAANDVDKNENLPKVLAIVAGVAIAAVAVVISVYSGLWSPPASSLPAKAAAVTHQTS